jgi:hypothetical protein
VLNELRRQHMHPDALARCDARRGRSNASAGPPPAGPSRCPWPARSPVSTPAGAGRRSASRGHHLCEQEVKGFESPQLHPQLHPAKRTGARSWNNRTSNIGRGERLSGPRGVRGQRGAGRVRLGASCGGHDQAHQADTCRRPSAGPSGQLTRGSRNASRPRKAPAGSTTAPKDSPERSDGPDPKWGQGPRPT